MKRSDSWYMRPEFWLEAFVLVNLAFLSLDIYIAHSMNEFRHKAEYVPLYFSMAAPFVLLVGLVLRERWQVETVWRDLGHLVGWLAVGIGLVGTILHLRSGFFMTHTIKSLAYAAPFAAPLAYTGLGLLLIMNRTVEAESTEWSLWVILLALGGFFGNFLFCLTDHAQNGLYYPSEWVAVGVSALAVGALASIYCTPVTRNYLWLCAGVLALQVFVGMLGFYYHVCADLQGPSPDWFTNFVHGAPSLAPLLFPNLALLAAIGLFAYARNLQAESTLTGDVEEVGSTAYDEPIAQDGSVGSAHPTE